MSIPQGQEAEERLTESHPLSEVNVFGSIWSLDEACIKVGAKVLDHLVHMRFQGQHTTKRVILNNRSFHASMLGLVSGAEEVVGDLAIDDGTIVVIEFSLSSVNKTKNKKEKKGGGQGGNHQTA